MRVSYNWLKELVEFDLAAETLAERLTMAGLAVEDLIRLGEGIENVVVGQITAIEKHQNSDHLLICTVACGTDEPVQIVTGAPNVAVGQKVPVALVGATLPGGIKIKKSRLRGVDSYGMLCSAAELQINPEDPEAAAGIMVLAGDAPVGADILTYLGLNDVIFELELTPNRADCLSVINVAREVAAVTGGTLRLPEIGVVENEERIQDYAAVTIQAPDLCYRYAARVVKGIRIGPSPGWMQRRLRASGIRPINNIVDVTNYVMLEMGQPLHAFDYRLLRGNRIVVRRANDGEKITTLDGITRILDRDMLVIADSERAVAIAGVMGGENTEIAPDTTTVLLESAYFAPVSVRKTSRKLGLRSESALRFEKGINLDGTVAALNRAAQLIEEMGAGLVVGGVIDEYVHPYNPICITLRVSRCNEILGTDLSAHTVEEILGRLGFTAQRQGRDRFDVDIPAYRNDITLEIDLIEEIARIYGYDRIPTTLPKGVITQGRKTWEQQVRTRIADILTGCGLTEVITNSFINPQSLDQILLPEDSMLRCAVRVQNPLSEDQGIMRTSLIPGLLSVISRNQHRRLTDLALYEMGNVFFPWEVVHRSEREMAAGAGETPGQPAKENLTLAGAICGEIFRGWSEKPLAADFFLLKGIVESLLARIGLKDCQFVPETGHPTFHPGRTARIVNPPGETVGIIGEIYPDVAANYDLVRTVYLFELNLERILPHLVTVKRYRTLPRFPASERDMALIVPEDVPAAEIVAAVKKEGKPLLAEVRLFDVYRGSQIPAGCKSLAFSLVYQAGDRTLTDEEVNLTHDRIREKLEQEFGASLR